MAEGFEYVAVNLPSNAGQKTRDREVTEALNAVASNGWRLVSVLPSGQLTTACGIFERPVDWTDAE